MIRSTILLLVGMLLVGCCLAAAGCKSIVTGEPDDVEVLATSDWITFSSGDVSIQLPDTFVGGDPNDPAVAAELQELLMIWVDAWFAEQLKMVGQVDASGDRPVVTVYRHSLPSDMSFEFFATTVWDLSFDEFRIEKLTSDEAYLVGSKFPSGLRYSGGGIAWHVALKLVEVPEEDARYVYAVDCWCSTALAGEYDAIFRTSAQTLVVEPQGDQ